MKIADPVKAGFWTIVILIVLAFWIVIIDAFVHLWRAVTG